MHFPVIFERAQGAAANLNFVVVSCDKDFQQLLRPGIWLLNPGRGGPASVEEQWVSVEPENKKGLPFYYARGFELRGQRPEWGTAPEEGHVSLRLMRRLDPR